MNFSQGHSGTKVQCEDHACFPKEKTPEFTKMGELHELFVLALSLVWFAGASPDESCQMGGCHREIYLKKSCSRKMSGRGLSCT